MPTSVRRTRSAVALVVAAGALAFVPSALASTFGSSLNHTPANAGSQCNQGSSAPPVSCTHVGSFYPGTSGHAKASSSGEITKIRIRPEAAMTFRFELVKVRNVSSNHQHGQARVVFQSHPFHVPGPNPEQLSNGMFPIQTIPADITNVSKGDELAITTKDNQAEYCSDGTPGQLTFFGPILRLNQPFRTNNNFDGCLLLVQAVIT